MKKLKLFIAWLDYKLCGITHPKDIHALYRIQIYHNYLNELNK